MIKFEFKVNKLTRYVPKPPKEAFLNEYRERNVTNVVLSHLPLLFKPGSFAGDVSAISLLYFTGYSFDTLFQSGKLCFTGDEGTVSSGNLHCSRSLG